MGIADQGTALWTTTCSTVVALRSVMDHSCSKQATPTSLKVLCSTVLLLLGYRAPSCAQNASGGGPRAPDEGSASLPIAEAPVSAPTVDVAIAAHTFTCSARMEAARAKLLGASFNPANNTPDWLEVRGRPDGGLLLAVYTVYSPDGDGYRTYEAELSPSRRKRPMTWQLVQRSVLDEFKEERLPERTWTRRRGGWIARIHTRTENRKLVDLFEWVVREALDDCLAHPGQVGKMETRRV